MVRRLVVLAVTLAALAAPSSGWCHGMRTAFVDVTQVEAGRALVRLRTRTADPGLSLAADEPCHVGRAGDDGGPVELVCPGSLEGVGLSLVGLGPVHTEAVLAVVRRDGTRVAHLATAASPRWSLPVTSRPLDVARQYVGLGVAHIASGADHLAFLVGLVLLLRRPRAVIAAETAFTASHTLSFTATALGLVRVSAAAAEACIALSLLLVALDVSATKTPATRHGAAVAFVFGLVHGLGFAGGLREIGLPDHDAALALAGFAAGVEVGQVVFLGLALGALHLVAKRVPFERVAPWAAAALGGTSAFWFLDRVAGLWARG